MRPPPTTPPDSTTKQKVNLTDLHSYVECDFEPEKVVVGYLYNGDILVYFKDQKTAFTIDEKMADQMLLALSILYECLGRNIKKINPRYEFKQ